MRLQIWCLSAVFFVIAVSILAGCGGSSGSASSTPSGVKLVIKFGSGSGTETAINTKSATPCNPPNCNGSAGNYNSSTAYSLAGTLWQCVTSLQPKLHDSDGNEVALTADQCDEVQWTVSDPSIVYQTWGGSQIDITPPNPGKYTITASLNDPTLGELSDTITVLAYKRIPLSNVAECTPGLKLNGYISTIDDADMTITQHDNNTPSFLDDDSFTINAPHGIAIVKSEDAVWCDPEPRQDLGFIKTVPDGLEYTTSVDLTVEKSYIAIVRDGNGGYAKMALTFGLYGSPWTYNFIDTFMEYSPTENFQLYY